jgi:inhibitor of cysteine peptidase
LPQLLCGDPCRNDPFQDPGTPCRIDRIPVFTAQEFSLIATFIRISPGYVTISKVNFMKSTYIIALTGCILVLAAGLIAGCTISSPAAGPGITTAPAIMSPTTAAPPVTSLTGTAPPAPGETVPTLFVNGTSSGKIVTIPLGERVLVRLAENPSTGYTWNATASKGLVILKDTYTATETSLPGAPGYHEWILSPKTVDTYKFSAVSLRPWEGALPTDESFSLVLVVTKN